MLLFDDNQGNISNNHVTNGQQVDRAILYIYIVGYTLCFGIDK